MRTILAVGQDEGLLYSRTEILRKCAGKSGVVWAKSHEAVDILKAQRFDLVVLCHTLSMEDLIRIALLAHNQGVDVKVLQIVKPSKAEANYESVAADELAFPDPAILMAKVEKLLNAQARSREVQ